MVLELILGAALIGVGIRSHRRKHEKRYWREVARQEQVNNAALGSYASTLAARQNAAAAGTVVTQQRTVVQPVAVPVPVPVAVPQSPSGMQQMYPNGMYTNTSTGTMGYQQQTYGQPTMVNMPAQQMMVAQPMPQQQMQMISPRYAPQQQQQTPYGQPQYGHQYMQQPSTPMNQQMQMQMQTRPPATAPAYMTSGAPPAYNQTPRGVPMNVHPDFLVPDTTPGDTAYRQI